LEKGQGEKGVDHVGAPLTGLNYVDSARSSQFQVLGWGEERRGEGGGVLGEAFFGVLRVVRGFGRK
jgi:hypothetical protein